MKKLLILLVSGVLLFSACVKSTPEETDKLNFQTSTKDTDTTATKKEINPIEEKAKKVDKKIKEASLNKDNLTKGKDAPTEKNAVPTMRTKVINIFPEQDLLFVYALDQNSSMDELFYINLSNSELMSGGHETSISEVQDGKMLEVELRDDSVLSSQFPDTVNGVRINILPDPPKTDKKEELGKVFIAGSKNTITIYSDTMELPLVEMMSLEYDAETNTLKESGFLYQDFFVEKDEKVAYDAVYAEGIPSMKLKWVLPDGQIGEYILTYDGRTGEYPSKSIVYYSNGEFEERE